MPSDDFFMREAIALARLACGKTHPNPSVGCVIVRAGQIIGRGYHHRAGEPHAEIEALRSLPDASLARGSTAYITLEPCSTHGRTPPCTSALLAAGISRVVVGAIDPNPKHHGNGLDVLRQSGVLVSSGILASECESLNPEFNHTMTTGLPWVIVKCGMSLDGRLTRPPSESRFITSLTARSDAMTLRTRADAILVGAGTVRADNPSLTIRDIPDSHQQPLRVIWAPRTPPPKDALLFADEFKSQTLVLDHPSIRDALRELVARGILTVLVEGGGFTLGQILDQHLASEAVIYIAPLLAGGSIPAFGGKGTSSLSLASQLVNPQFLQLADNLRISGYLKIPRK